MANLVVAESFFELRILQKIAREEASIDTDVDIFIDGRRNNESTKLAKICGLIGSAAAERYPQGCPRDYHLVVPALRYRSVSARPAGEPIS